MAARKRSPKPAPVVVTTVCSICGEDWLQHQEVDGEVSTLECVRLLKAKLAAQPTVIFQRTYPTVITTPYAPAPIITTPWTPTWTCGGSLVDNGSSATYVQNTNDSCTPTVALASAA